MSMELSMTIALLALAIREYFTAVIILLFVLIAEMLEGLTVDPAGTLGHPSAIGPAQTRHCAVRWNINRSADQSANARRHRAAKALGGRVRIHRWAQKH
jgi:hypothetical protein